MVPLLQGINGCHQATMSQALCRYKVRRPTAPDSWSVLGNLGCKNIYRVRQYRQNDGQAFARALRATGKVHNERAASTPGDGAAQYR
jgi:hypothetical protein